MERFRFSLKLILLVVVSSSVITWVTAEVSEVLGNQLLDKREAEVKLLKSKVEENYRRRCEFLRTCGGPMNCSRHACEQLNLGEVGNYLTCQKVVNNAYCPEQNCPTSKYFDYTRSYVRLAANPTDASPTETAAIICSQRELDATFKSMCTKDSHTRLFLGTVDGTYIHFPGSARDPAATNGCYDYDPRLRPWFRASTSVRKIVMVLVDGGALRSTLSTPLSGTFLDLMRAIVKDLLNTLTEQDAVNVIVYDNSGSIKMARTPAQFVFNVSANSTYHPEFDELLGNLSSLSSGESRVGSNITFGITGALADYALYDETFMKTIIVFTYGYGINTLKNGSLTPLEGKNAKMFVFILPVHNDEPIQNDPFFTQLQSLGGSYNVLSTTNVTNRLLSMLPYFSFLAHFRASLDDSADYSVVYQDFEQLVRKAFSITKPVFGDGGRLLGTVGLNILVDELPEDDGRSMNLSLTRRIRAKAFDPSKFNLTAANASIIQSNMESCVGIKQPKNAGLCEKNDSRSIEHFACCRSAPGSSCILPPISNIAASSPSKVKVIVGSVLGTVAAIVIVILIVLFVLWWRARRKIVTFLGIPPPPPE